MSGLLRRVAPSVHGAVDPQALAAEGVALAGLIDFSSNQSPLGASPKVAASLREAVIDAYPDPRASALRRAFGERHGVDAAQIVCGNGSTELIRLVAQLALRPGDTALAVAPVFGESDVATALAGATLEHLPLRHLGATRGFAVDEGRLTAALTTLHPRLCWLCSPNNPTGAALPAGLVESLTSTYRETLFVLDEAYCDLLPEPQWTPAQLNDPGNLVVLRSLTKYWGLAGARLGYAVAGPGAAAALSAAVAPWSVNAFAQVAGLAALNDGAHHERAVGQLVAERDRLRAALAGMGWVTEPSAAGFFLVYARDARALRAALLARGLLVRDCTSFGLPAHIRLSPRHAVHNDRLLAAFAELEPPKPQR